jgi:hypothetical protein
VRRETYTVAIKGRGPPIVRTIQEEQDMDQNRGKQQGVVTFQREKPRTDEQTDLQGGGRPKKKESAGRSVIAWVVIVILIVPIFGSLVSGAGATGAGFFLWLVCLGLIALVAKWARWY